MGGKNISNKKILITLLLATIVLFSINAISASDMNITDSSTIKQVDDMTNVSLQVANSDDSSKISILNYNNIPHDSLSDENVIESDNSNILSTNQNNNSLKENLTTKKSTKIISQTTNIYYKGYYSITLKDSNDTILVGKLINFKVNNVSYNNTTDNNGHASVQILLTPGTYTIIASFAGDAEYENSTNVSSINVSSTIVAKNITKYYKGTTKYTATFYTSQGTYLANTSVKISVNGKNHTVKTNNNGVASLSINLKPGTYKIVSTDPTTNYTLTTTFKILSTITANDLSKVYKDNRKFSAKFYKSNGKVLANKKIKFKINGKIYNVKTNKKGIAKLSLKNLKKGTYKIISYNKDGLTKTNKVKVYRKVSTKLIAKRYSFLKSNKNKKIKVTLHNSLGYAPSPSKIIKIKVNGKTYSKKTNSKGVVSLKLPKLKSGVYTVKYSFAGDKYYKSSSTSKNVYIYPTKNPTFKIKSGTTFEYSKNNTFKLAVTSGKVPVINKKVTFILNGTTYTKKTNTKGIASLPLDLMIGKYNISYSIAKSSKINAKSGSTSITIEEKSVKIHNAYWLYGADMKNVDLKDLSSKGVTDVLLNFKAYELYGKSGVETWISTANNVGIKTHIWVQVFYSEATNWVNPLKNGTENTEYFAQKIDEIKTYASLKGLSGIHLDYLRYSGSGDNAAYKNSGGIEAINSFVTQAKTAIKSVNKNLILSCALMPETTNIAYYYGQDYAALSKSMDVVIPMVYKNSKSSDWITSTAQWYVKNSQGAKVWIGIQTYAPNNSKLSVAELNKDVSAALKSGADGVVLFRYGISNDIDFKTVMTSSALVKSMSIKNIITAATKLKNYYESNKKLPNTVTAGEYKFTLPEFLYLMSQAIYQISKSNTQDVNIISGVSAPSSPSGDNINSKDLKTYVTVAKTVANYIVANNKAPNYVSSDVGKIIYSELVDSFSRVLAFYDSKKTLPKYVTINYSSTSSESTGSGLNEKNSLSASELKKYLKSTTNCQVDNSKIKSLVNSLTKGLTSDSQKATAIFNYVRDTISYSFYYDTKYGAVNTLKNKKGNCVDHSHLLIAMFRTADLPARYVHGSCKFTSGSTYGHVWVQVLIGDTWTVADATSSKNSLGKISNWNTKTFKLYNKYVSFPS